MEVVGVMSFLQWEDQIGVRDQWDLIQHTHLVLFLVTSTLHKQQKIMEFSYSWEFLLESSVVKAKI